MLLCFYLSVRLQINQILHFANKLKISFDTIQ